MQIIHKIDDFLYTIFPELINGDESLIKIVIEKYFTFNASLKPSVRIENGFAIIEIDIPSIIAYETEYRKTIDLCEKGRFNEAKPILKKLIDINPYNSEYNRIMGQILSEEGSQDEAIDYLIDALRLNSKNGWALLMMGNIFAKFKNDIPTALKYYDQALVANVNDFISLTNVGYLLFQEKRYSEAKKYFYEALKINDKFPNAYLALGMIAEKDNEPYNAFNFTLQAIKFCSEKDMLYQKSVQQAIDISKHIVSSLDGMKIVKTYKHKLEFEGGTEIDIIEDSEITTAAKIEFAENYKREKHIVKYKSNLPAVEHLIIHELVHYFFVIEARKSNINQLFISSQQHKREFIKTYISQLHKLRKMGMQEPMLEEFLQKLFEGINLQAYNTPIDLFIENYLFNNYEKLRPYQFLSLYRLLQEGINAVTNTTIVDFSPKEILSKSKIYNLVNALQFKELYGIDLIKELKGSAVEFKTAKDFYNEFLQYKDDREVAEEYELVLHWAEDLKLDKNFELVDENEYRTKRTNVDNLLNSIEKDPYTTDARDLYKERDLEKFMKSQQDLGVNMAVVMFMVEAINYFNKLPSEEIKKIAFEIATQGTQGFSPNNNNYAISAIPDKLFSGYHILSYYYVSWAMAIPEQLDMLGLNFQKEYKLALNMYKN
jgi:hypothetical protein